MADSDENKLKNKIDEFMKITNLVSNIIDTIIKAESDELGDLPYDSYRNIVKYRNFALDEIDKLLEEYSNKYCRS